MTLPAFEEKLLQLMDARAQDLENASLAQSKTNVKEELKNLSLTIASGNINIPVDNLLPGNLGAQMDIAAGGAVISAGARMDQDGMELTDQTLGELQFPSNSVGDWFTSSASGASPTVHSGLGFYNDNAADARGLLFRASGAASGTRVGRIHFAADNGNQVIAGSNTTAELRLSSVNSGIAFAEFFNHVWVNTGELVVNNARTHLHQGLTVNNQAADINAGLDVNGLLISRDTEAQFQAGVAIESGLRVLTGAGIFGQGATVSNGGMTIQGSNASWGLAVQAGTFYADHASIHQAGIQVNGAIADINSGADIAGGLTVSGGATLTGQLINQNGAIFNTGLQSNGANTDINSGMTVAGGVTVETGNFSITTNATLVPQFAGPAFTLGAGATASWTHGFGDYPRFIFGQSTVVGGTFWGVYAAEKVNAPGMVFYGTTTLLSAWNNTAETYVVRINAFK